MRKIILHRIKNELKYTAGKLEVWQYDRSIPIEKILELASLELPYLSNQKNISCIPKGRYECKVATRPNGDKAISILRVPERTNILIHKGNFTADIQGCILVGLLHADINNDGITDVVDSGIAMSKLLGVLPQKSKFELIII